MKPSVRAACLGICSVHWSEALLSPACSRKDCRCKVTAPTGGGGQPLALNSAGGTHWHTLAHTLAHTGGTHWHTNQTAHSTSTSHIDVHCSTLHTRSSLLTGQWTPTECTSHTTHDPLLVNITHVPQKHTRPYIHTQV